MSTTRGVKGACCLAGLFLGCASATVPPDPECLLHAPARIHLRDNLASFNQRYQIWLCKGGIYIKPITDFSRDPQAWQKLWLPPELADQVSGLDIDDRFMHAADARGELWMNYYALDTLEHFSWSPRRGFPMSIGSPNILESGHIRWALSSTSAELDQHYTDASGWLRKVGWASCTHVFLLKAGGQWIGFNDGWLPADWNYEMCGPRRGRFVAVNLASSGSRHMLINHRGDIYTRVFDYDVSGANNPFEDYFDYTYGDQSGLLDDTLRRFQLPSWPWFQQPKVPGRITDRISLHKLGTGSLHAAMRVEGWDADGHRGYYEKDMHDVVEDPDATTPWRFVRTDHEIGGTELDNLAQDSTERTLGVVEDACFAHNLDARSLLPGRIQNTIVDEDWALELIDLHPYCSPALLRVHVAPDRYYDLVLHTTETLRTSEVLEQPGRGLLSSPRPRQGTIEIPLNLFRHYAEGRLHPVMRAFVEHYLQGRRFSWAEVQASRDQVTIRKVELLFWGIDWSLQRVDCARTSRGENHGLINDPELDGDTSYGFPFEDLYLDPRAAQIATDPSTGAALPSKRTIHDMQDLGRLGW
ncbi:MAG: hypothetical protein ABIJ09_13455 [Pseudomonadota bacterium]